MFSSTIKDLALDYEELVDEVDVYIPYTLAVEDVNNQLTNDVDFVNHFGLDYDQVNCIELI